MPKVSVIMPVYNTKEEYLREAIESILNQTFTDFELLVVDDASTEDVSRVINSYSDERIHYYRLAKNEGAAGARNYALSKATGDYIALMDSDDVSYSTRFEKQIAYLEDHPEIGCLGSGADAIGDDKDKINFPCVSGHEAIEAFLIFEGCAFCQSTVMVRKSILDKYNIQYNKQEYAIAEDYALWLDLVGKTEFENLNEKLVAYRFHYENISHLQKERQVECASLAQVAAIKKYCGLKKLDDEVLSHFYSGQQLSHKELEALDEQLSQIMKKLKDKNLSNYSKNFKKRFKKQYYKVHSLKGQLALFKSPLNQEFNISLPFRLFCLLTRGVL